MIYKIILHSNCVCLFDRLMHFQTALLDLNVLIVQATRLLWSVGLFPRRLLSNNQLPVSDLFQFLRSRKSDILFKAIGIL